MQTSELTVYTRKKVEKTVQRIEIIKELLVSMSF